MTRKEEKKEALAAFGRLASHLLNACPVKLYAVDPALMSNRLDAFGGENLGCFFIRARMKKNRTFALLKGILCPEVDKQSVMRIISKTAIKDHYTTKIWH